MIRDAVGSKMTGFTLTKDCKLCDWVLIREVIVLLQSDLVSLVMPERADCKWQLLLILWMQTKLL